MKLNKEAVYVAIIIALAALCGQFYYSYHWKPAREIQVYYNKEVAFNDKIIRLVQDSDKFVYFSIYTFTRADIKDALLGAKYRGLDVQGVIDQDQTANIEQQGKLVKELRAAGIPMAEHTHSGIMHTKVVVTDKGYASGSYNWTASPPTINDEVLEVGHDETVRRQYQTVVEKLLRKYAK